MSSFYDISVPGIDGSPHLLERLRGRVTLAVNVASECGLTPQYSGLEQLQRELKDHNFTVLGFPCNQFGNQDPGENEEIGAFCQKNYGVSFPMFEKVNVNGTDAHPVFQWLREEKGGVLGDAIKWNFTKFLIARDGTVLKRYGSTTEPERIASDIEKALAA